MLHHQAVDSQPVGGWQDALQGNLGLFRGFRLEPAQSVAYTIDMNIDTGVQLVLSQLKGIPSFCMNSMSNIDKSVFCGRSKLTSISSRPIPHVFARALMTGQVRSGMAARSSMRGAVG